MTEFLLTYEELLVPPPQRRKGIKSEVWFTGLVLLMGCIVICGPFLMRFAESLNILKVDRSTEPVIYALVGILIFVLVIGWITLFSPQFRTVFYSRWHYPKVWHTSQSLCDSARQETFMYYLPVLNLDGQKFFLTSYHHASDTKLLVPIATLLLSGDGRVIENDELFKQVHIIFNLAIMTTTTAQSQLDNMRRSGQNLLKRHIPQTIRILERNRSRFVDAGSSTSLDRTLRLLQTFRSSVLEVDRFLMAREGYVRSIGYGFGSEFFYEDAERLRLLSQSFVSKLHSEFVPEVMEMSLLAVGLLRDVEINAGGWRNVSYLKKMLDFLVQSNSALHTYDVFQNEAQVPVATWDNYHKKLQAVKSLGVPVFSE